MKSTAVEKIQLQSDSIELCLSYLKLSAKNDFLSIDREFYRVYYQNKHGFLESDYNLGKLSSFAAQEQGEDRLIHENDWGILPDLFLAVRRVQSSAQPKIVGIGHPVTLQKNPRDNRFSRSAPGSATVEPRELSLHDCERVDRIDASLNE